MTDSRIDSHIFIEVAGRSFSADSSKLAIGQSGVWSFEWDGNDAYGRPMQGEQNAVVTTCSSSPAVEYSYADPASVQWAQPSFSGKVIAYRGVGPFAFDVCARPITTKLGGWNNKALALGGWRLSSHHVLDVANKVIYRGDGGRQSVDDLNRYVSNIVAGNGSSTSSGATDGAIATTLPLPGARGTAVGPDGSLYFSTDGCQPTYCAAMIGRISPDGIFHFFAGGPGGGSDGEGVPALQAHLNSPTALAFGPDGSLYFSESTGSWINRIRKIGPDGLVYTVAGAFGGSPAFTPDGAIATTAMLNLVYSSNIAVGQDGTIFFTEPGNNRVRKVGPDGILRTAAGTGTAGLSGDSGPATSAMLSAPDAVALALDGSLIFIDRGNSRVRRVTVDGTISTIAGAGAPCSFGFYSCGEGGPATQARFNFQDVANGLTISPDGTIFVADTGNLAIRRFVIGGNIDTIAGAYLNSGGCSGRDCPAKQVLIGRSWAISFGIAGDLFGGGVNGSIYRLTSSQVAQQIGVTNITVPSPDASEVYVFDLNGRHLRTLDALTNVPTQTFGYDSSGRLITIADRDDNTTIVQRDSQGNPTSIVGPYGQQTTLGLGSDGYLHTVTNPNGETVQLSYTSVVSGDPHTGGLLSQFTDARNGSAFYTYDNDGFLTRNTEPDGSYYTYTRGGSLAPTRVVRTSALGRTQVFGLTRSSNGDAESRSIQEQNGLTTNVQRNADHSGSVTSPDGTTVTTQETADPRFGMQAGYVSSTTTRLPSALTRTETRSRSVNLSNPQDPLSLATLIESVTVNGRTSNSTYTSAARQMQMISAAGRATTMTYDALGHVTQIASPGVLPMVLHYDARGRNDTITQGTRVTTLAYDAAGFLHSVVDPAQNTTIFGYDLAGRPTSETLPDLNVIGMGYDANGNATSVTPPSRPAHVFAFTSASLESDYTPPGGQSFNTHTAYNLDQQVSSVLRADGDFITPAYDSAKGRLTALTTSRGTNSYGYSNSTGQLTSISTFDGVGLTYGYDGSLLKDITWSGPVLGNVHKTYDSSFRLASESVTGGQTINFGYDNDDLLTSAGAMTITRDPATGFITATDLGAIHETRSYDAYGAEQHYTVTANGSTLYEVDYGTRDALGRIVQKTETVQGTTHVYGYTYDANGRLADVTTDGNATSHYEYDANGNRLVGPGLTASPVYDNQDRLLSYGSCTYSYKNDGSLQTKTCPDGTTTYDYDAFGNLRGVTLPSGTAITYLIDGQNRRVGKKINGTLVESFVYENSLKRVGWYDGTGALKAQFVFAQHAQVPDVMLKAGTTYKIGVDQVGTVRLVSDASGSIVERLDYDEFGNLLSDSNSGFQPFGFGGGLADRDTGLVRMGSRDFDPTSGRWVGRDSIDFDGGDTNLYRFGVGDPINRIDPSGLAVPFPIVLPICIAFPEVCIVGAAAAAAGVGAWLGIYCSSHPGACPWDTPAPPDSCMLRGGRGDVGTGGEGRKRDPYKWRPNKNNCMNACAIGGPAMEAFCRVIKDPDKAQQCWAATLQSEAECMAMCTVIF